MRRIAAIITLVALGSSGLTNVVALDASGAPAESVVVQDPTAACAAVEGLKIDAARIGLPTRGAVLDAATLVAANGDTGDPEYCLARGHIRGHDPAAPPIQFEVNLPTVWNKGSLQFGGGGYDGVLVTGLGSVPGGTAPASVVPRRPIARGYATFGGDAGAAVGDNPVGSFGMNAEAVANYDGQSVKRTRDAAIDVVKTYYGRLPARQYFAGSSKGGHEALVAAERYGQDYDGVIAFYPANETMALILGFHNIQQAWAREGGSLNAADSALLANAVLKKCDRLDGLKDGLIAAVDACGRAFDVNDLRCTGVSERGANCLSRSQINTLETAARPFRFAFPLAHGVTEFGRFPVFSGGGLAASDIAGYEGLTTPMIKYFIAQDPDASVTGFDYTQYEDRVKFLSRDSSTMNPDLDRFVAGGGKLILVQGTTDMIVPERWTSSFFDRVIKRYGSRTSSFARYYVQPGYGHGTSTFDLSWDSLTALDNWVVDGVAPHDQVAVDGSAATRDRAMPLCEYPTYPRYVSGDPRKARSFSCVSDSHAGDCTSPISLTASARSQRYRAEPSRRVLLTAHVATAAGNGRATGSVRFVDGARVIATVPLKDGRASYRLARHLGVGRHAMAAKLAVPGTPTATCISNTLTVRVLRGR